jgi:hypothetical protein
MAGTGEGEAVVREGSRLECPGCHAATVVKVVNRLDGWTCVGRAYVCALCGHDFGPADATGAAHSPKRGKSASEAAMALFGEAMAPAARAAILDEPRGHFCKDCRHFFKHPFRTTCLLHEREVRPMGDCPEYEARCDESEDEGRDVSGREV